MLYDVVIYGYMWYITILTIVSCEDDVAYFQTVVAPLFFSVALAATARAAWFRWVTLRQYCSAQERYAYIIGFNHRISCNVGY